LARGNEGPLLRDARHLLSLLFGFCGYSGYPIGLPFDERSVEVQSIPIFLEDDFRLTRSLKRLGRIDRDGRGV
jgi:hypothetical protein